MKIDIFVCTHNRHKELVECLKSIKKLKSEFSLFVIDSSDKKLSKSYQKLVDKYIYDKSLKPLSKKRNLAIESSTSEFIAFTDDDCIVDKGWIVELLKGFKDKKIACVTGLTLPFKGYESTNYEKRYSFGKIGKKEKVIEKKLINNLWRIGHGNNMAFRKEVFKKIGLFDEALGVGSEGLAGEDTDMFYRIIKNGYKIVYNPNAIIYHKHLVKDEELPKIAYRNGFAIKKIVMKHKNTETFILYLAILLKYSIKFLFGFKKVEKSTIEGLLGIKKF